MKLPPKSMLQQFFTLGWFLAAVKKERIQCSPGNSCCKCSPGCSISWTVKGIGRGDWLGLDSDSVLLKSFVYLAF